MSTTQIYLASSKKEATERVKKDFKSNFSLQVYKRLSKGNTLYKVIFN